MTESEAVLARLADRSFLSLWAYPNVFKEVNRELTDLLVVFGDDVILFSDKSCAYGDAEEPTAWRRWYKKAIAKSARQVQQAEHWIRTRPNQVFLDVHCTVPLPVALPPPDRVRVHRVCVATGAAARRLAETGRPSLAIDLTVVGHDERMRIGAVEEAGGWLHVFDESSLDTVFGELDTAPDFLAYLTAKEALASGGQWRGAESELDVLASYIWNNRGFREETEPYVFKPDLWTLVTRHRNFQNGKAANRVSIFWDGLIERVTGLYVARQLEFGNDVALDQYERLMRRMAAEGRFHRRLLSQMILQRASRARHGWVPSLLPSSDPTTLYVLLIGPGPGAGEPPDDYRRRRVQELHLRCYAAKAVRPEIIHFVGLGLDARGVAPSSEDFLYLDTTEWAERDRAEAVKIQARTEFWDLEKAQLQRVQLDEYPD